MPFFEKVYIRNPALLPHIHSYWLPKTFFPSLGEVTTHQWEHFLSHSPWRTAAQEWVAPWEKRMCFAHKKQGFYIIGQARRGGWGSPRPKARVTAPWGKTPKAAHSTTIAAVLSGTPAYPSSPPPAHQHLQQSQWPSSMVGTSDLKGLIESVYRNICGTRVNQTHLLILYFMQNFGWIQLTGAGESQWASGTFSVHFNRNGFTKKA